MSRTTFRVLCGVPDEFCKGSPLKTDQVFHTKKCHQSHADAFRCMAQHLTRDLGFVRLSSRDFQAPNGGPIRILTRQSNYGAHLKPGKLGERHEPDEKKNNSLHGVVIG